MTIFAMTWAPASDNTAVLSVTEKNFCVPASVNEPLRERNRAQKCVASEAWSKWWGLMFLPS